MLVRSFLIDTLKYPKIFKEIAQTKPEQPLITRKRRAKDEKLIGKLFRKILR